MVVGRHGGIVPPPGLELIRFRRDAFGYLYAVWRGSGDFSADFPSVLLTSYPFATPNGCQENIMFASLEDQMKHDDARATSPQQRMTKWAVIAFVAVAVFGGLYYAIQAFA
jgi:hypothetical protein